MTGELSLARSMVFASPAMSRLAVLVHRVAARDVTVLIRGESGTGKERILAATHRDLAQRVAEGKFREAPRLGSMCRYVYPLDRRLDERGHGLRLRHINCVTALLLDNRRTGPLGHKALGRGRDHLVLGRHQVPARLTFPRRLADRALERFHSPRNL